MRLPHTEVLYQASLIFTFSNIYLQGISGLHYGAPLSTNLQKHIFTAWDLCSMPHSFRLHQHRIQAKLLCQLVIQPWNICTNLEARNCINYQHHNIHIKSSSVSQHTYYENNMHETWTSNRQWAPKRIHSVEYLDLSKSAQILTDTHRYTCLVHTHMTQ